MSNAENKELLRGLYTLLFEGGHFDLAVLAAICLKDKQLLNYTLLNSDLKGRYEFRVKNNK